MSKKIYYDAELNKIIEGMPPACSICGSDERVFYGENNVCFRCEKEVKEDHIK